MTTSGTKQKLDELYDLLQSKYITEEEFHAGKRNILRDAGFDIADRDGELPSAYRPRPREREGRPKKQGCGCGCLFSLLLLAVILGGVLLALPEDVVNQVPGLERIFGEAHVQAARREVQTLLDSWLGAETQQKLPPALPKLVSPDEAAVPIPLVSDEPKPETSAEPRQEPQPEATEPTLAPSEATEDSTPSFPAKAVIVASSVQLRPSPDSKRILARGLKGDELTLLEEATGEGGQAWYRVRLERDGKEGWLSATQVELED